MKKIFLFSALILTIFLSGCQTPAKTYQYQYTLYSDADDKVVAANVPYYLAVTGHDEISDKSKQTLVTDKNGQTHIITSTTPIDEKEVTLVERFGQGMYGEIFYLESPSKTPLKNVRYKIDISCPDKEVVSVTGITNRRGQTKYIATEQACSLELNVAD